jgi:hypothetical protein
MSRDQARLTDRPFDVKIDPSHLREQVDIGTLIAHPPRPMSVAIR